MILDIPDDLMPLVRFDAHDRLITSQAQYHDLERRFGVGHPDALRAKVLYDQAKRIVAIVDPEHAEQVAA